MFISTGNDLSQVLGWGKTIERQQLSDIKKFGELVEERVKGEVTGFDVFEVRRRWFWNSVHVCGASTCLLCVISTWDFYSTRRCDGWTLYIHMTDIIFLGHNHNT